MVEFRVTARRPETLAKLAQRQAVPTKRSKVLKPSAGVGFSVAWEAVLTWRALGGSSGSGHEVFCLIFRMLLGLRALQVADLQQRALVDRACKACILSEVKQYLNHGDHEKSNIHSVRSVAPRFEIAPRVSAVHCDEKSVGFSGYSVDVRLTGLLEALQVLTRSSNAAQC